VIITKTDFEKKPMAQEIFRISFYQVKDKLPGRRVFAGAFCWVFRFVCIFCFVGFLPHTPPPPLPKHRWGCFGLSQNGYAMGGSARRRRWRVWRRDDPPPSSPPPFLSLAPQSGCGAWTCRCRPWRRSGPGPPKVRPQRGTEEGDGRLVIDVVMWRSEWTRRDVPTPRGIRVRPRAGALPQPTGSGCGGCCTSTSRTPSSPSTSSPAARWGGALVRRHPPLPPD